MTHHPEDPHHGTHHPASRHTAAMHTVLTESGMYGDSVFLMRVNSTIEQQDGVHRAVVAMATEANVELATMLGFAVPEGTAPDHLLMAIHHDAAVDVAALQNRIRTMIRSGRTGDETPEDRAPHDAVSPATSPATIHEAIKVLPQANLAVISVAGAWAPAEVEHALKAGLSVLLFSDNVDPADEVRLKRMARERGLLLMGPDCGTALIGGVAVCFANVVRRGPIGIVAASGTGLQEVSARIHNCGSGVSHGIGTGGRDLKSSEAGGMMALAALELLAHDRETAVIVIISKPPAREVAEKLHSAAQRCGKPVVIHLVGATAEDNSPLSDAAVSSTVFSAPTLAGAADLAVQLAGGTLPDGDSAGTNAPKRGSPADTVSPPVNTLRMVHGLYTGGTLANEAQVLLERWQVPHTITDLGDDQYTVGRPHPMIDPTVRLEWIRTVARETPETGSSPGVVILLDFVLGYGAHPDPVGVTLPVIRELPPGITVVAAVVGTPDDPQGYRTSCDALEEAGVCVATTHSAAVLFAAQYAGAQHARLPATPRATPGATPPVTPSVPGTSSGMQLQSTEAAPSLRTLLSEGPQVINLGVRDFARELEHQNCPVAHLDWRPPARGNAALADLLSRLTS